MAEQRPDEPGADIALCFNVGSSSLKFALFRVDARDEQGLASGSVEQIGAPEARVKLRKNGSERERACPNANMVEALGTAFALLGEEHLPAPTVVGHRVVHGGQKHVAPERVTQALLESLEALVPLAPLHLPAGIAGIRAALNHLPNVPHVACFDTAFHAALPEYAARYPLPAELFEQGVRRYGFHGLSYEYVLSTLGEFPPNRVIVAHLGNGASLAAIREGRSVDTTMGFTPSGGIMMGTRLGDIDPGLLLYLQRERGYTLAALEHLVDHESGLLGVGGSPNLQTLTQRAAQDPGAHLAILMFGYSVRKAIGAYFAALGGLDLLVFTGGIGEHSPIVRAEACRGLDALGLRLDEAKNESGQGEIQAGTCPVLVVPTDEDRMIARHARAVLSALEGNERSDGAEKRGAV